MINANKALLSLIFKAEKFLVITSIFEVSNFFLSQIKSKTKPHHVYKKKKN